MGGQGNNNRMKQSRDTLWLQVQIFYDHVDNTIQKSIDYAAGRRLRKLRPDKAWASIERLAQYENEGWNDAFVPEDQKRIFFRLATNEMYRPPSEPSRQEEFEHIVIIFVLDQEERIRQLEDYMQAITDEFMEFSSEVTQILKERIKENEDKPMKTIKITSWKKDIQSNYNHDRDSYVQLLLRAMSKRARSTRGQASSSHMKTMEEKVYKFGLLDNENHQMNHNNLVRLSIHCGDVVDWEFLTNKGLAQYDLLHKGITFRLGGVEREMSLLELGWRVGLYNVGNTKSKSIRNPRIRLAHRCITMTIMGRKETTHRITKIDLFYLYCIFGEGIVCNIPYWLTKYLKSVREKGMIFGGMFVTKIAWSFGLLTEEMVSVLSREPPPHVYRKTSLIKMGVKMELHEGVCYWPVTREVAREEEDDNEEGDGEGGNEGVGGSADVYRNMSQGEWQVHQAQWMGQQ
ncbi:hypothetical protein Tco_0040367 [Tanacetum coccineum]